jgi:hypothetical protein
MPFDFVHYHAYKLFVGDTIWRTGELEGSQGLFNADHYSSTHASSDKSKGIINEGLSEGLSVLFNGNLEPRLTQRKHIVGAATVFLLCVRLVTTRGNE